MRPTENPRFKICCIASVAEAQLAIEAGASALGLVSSMPSGPGVIPDELIAEIAATVRPGVDTFLLTSQRDIRAIIDQHRKAPTTTLQLVEQLPDGAHARLRAALPGIRLVQVIHVNGPEAIGEAAAVADSVDALLLDSSADGPDGRQLGGTGRRHDWAISATIREQVRVPTLLAGGLRAANVREAIVAVGPYGVDVCSGVRNDAGALDLAELGRFAAAVREPA